MPCQIDGRVYTANNVSSIPKADYNFTNAFVGDEKISVPTQCLFGMVGMYASFLGVFMAQTMLGDCINDDSTQLCHPWYVEGLTAERNASFETHDANMQAIALAITSEIRKQGTDYDGVVSEPPFDDPNDDLPGNLPPIYARGTVVRTAVCTQFDWK